MNYREYQAGDTIRVTDCQGRLFAAHGNRKLNNGVKLGVECVLVGGEDEEHDVKLPSGILYDGDVYISVACIELVQAVEDKPTYAIESKAVAIKHFVDGPDDCLYVIDDYESKDAIARIWYDPHQVPREVVKVFVENIKDIVIKRKINS